MCHNWIFDVLSDIRSYARLNGLPHLAAAATETIAVAERELQARPAAGRAEGGAAGLPAEPRIG